MLQQLLAGDTNQSPPAAPDDAVAVVPLKHHVRLAIAIALILVAVSAAWDAAVNQRYHWDVVMSYLFNPQILSGAVLTIVLTVISMTAGIALGTVLAIMRLSANPIV